MQKLYSFLQRKTNTIAFIPQIDGLRFVAIFMVLLFHINTFVITKSPLGFVKSPLDYWWIYQAGFTDAKGVLLFFSISGFILALPFAKHYWQNEKKIVLKNYFLRRLTRLEPPYFLVMVMSFLVLKYYSGHDFAASFGYTGVGLFQNLASSLVYLHNVVYPHIFSVNPVAWSLEIEIQFYLLVPLLVLILKLPKTSRRLLLVFLILFFTGMQYYYRPDFRTLYSYIQYFLLGFLLVDAYLSGWKLKLHPLASFIAGLLSLVLIFYIDVYRYAALEFIFIAVLFFFCFLVLTDTVWQKVFGLRLLTVIGGMCYSIYLIHTSVISAFGNKTVFWQASRNYPVYLLQQLAILLPIILLVCGIFYIVIERPCMDKDWPKKLLFKLKSLFMRGIFKTLFLPFLGKTIGQSFFKFLHLVALKGMNFGGGTDLKTSGEEWVINFALKKLSGPELIVFDVGANKGEYTAAWLRAFEEQKRSGRIYTFEPSSALVGGLKEKFKNSNVFVKQLAVGEKSGEQVLFAESAGSGLGSLYKRNLTHAGLEMTEQESVKVETLDNFTQSLGLSHIDFLKLDIEGYELLALKGAQKLLYEKKIRMLQFEFGGTDIDAKVFFKDFFALLHPSYKISRVLKNGLYEIKKYSEFEEIFVTTNYLAELKDLKIEK